MSERVMHSSAGWSAPAALPMLEPRRATVWLARVSEHGGAGADLLSLLDAGERETAQRFHFLIDRQRYVVAHGVLRLLLGAYTGRAPGLVQFTRGEFGKPSLGERAGSAPVGADALEFNLSHSGDLVAIAVSRSDPVGVDVEARVDLPDAQSLAQQFFSPAERQALASVDAGRRIAAFFDCWARKEAYIKATGLGLSEGLDYFDVALEPGVPAALLADRRPGATMEWALHDLDAPAGYAGALACATRLGVPARYVLSPHLARSLSERAA